MSGFAGGRVLILIVELFIKSSIILAAAILCRGLLRRRSAALRHFVLSISLVGLAFLPVFSVLSPGWHASWLPDWAFRAPVPLSGTGAAAAGAQGAKTEFPVEPGRTGASPSLPVDGAGALRPSAGPFRFGTILAALPSVLWLAGMVLVLARLAAGLWGARRITREGEALDDPVWRRLLRRFSCAVRLRRAVEIKAHPQVPIPVTCGFRRPVVIMPAATSDWSEEARSSALFHELSHVKRGDFLVMLFVRLSLALFWFNPLFWAAYKRLKDEQEKACDELVLKAGIRPSTYADNLLAIMRSVRLSRSHAAACPGVLGMFGRSQMRERLLAILSRKIAFKEVGMKTKVVVSVSVFLAVAFIGLARPQGAAAARGAGLLITEEAAPTTTTVVREQPAQDVRQKQEKQKKEETPPAAPRPEEGQVKKEVKIIKRAREHGQEPVEIMIIDGQTKKEIKLDGTALVVKKDKDGRTVLVSPEGRELAVIAGEGTQIKIKGGKTIRLADDEDFEWTEKPEALTIIEPGKGARTVIVLPKAHLEGEEVTEEPGHVTIKHVDKGDGEIIIKKRRASTEPHLAFQAEEEKLQKRLAETHALLKKLDEQKLAESSLAAQQESLRELEQSLKALREELDKREESLETMKTVLGPKPGFTHKRGEAPEVETEDVTPGEGSRENIVEMTRGRQASAIMLNMKLKDGSRETYEKTVAKLERELPQGYKLEPKFVEESGMMVIKITGPRGTEEDWEKVEALIKELQSELKK